MVRVNIFEAPMTWPVEVIRALMPVFPTPSYVKVVIFPLATFLKAG